jgi:hypothetical protein
MHVCAGWVGGVWEGVVLFSFGAEFHSMHSHSALIVHPVHSPNRLHELRMLRKNYTKSWRI